MNAQHLATITTELGIAPLQIEAVADLLADGATIPFIARYRKEVTGSLDEVQIQAIRDRIGQLAELDSRREAILASLEKHGHLTDELKEKVQAAETMAVLEDIYLPFRPKRRTKATIAREKGLEPLALLILDQEGADPEQAALPFVDAEKGVASTEEADAEAIGVFAANLRELLLAPPLGRAASWPWIRACAPAPSSFVSMSRGTCCTWQTIFPVGGKGQAEEAGRVITALVKSHRVQAIAVGNGTGGRETETFVRGLDLPVDVDVILVNEAGASVYSASEIARREFPDLDLTYRGAVSIGRRLMDPLAELVKIDPKSIGVGQYQHDVDQTALEKSLGDVVVSCVNQVGVDVNTASPELLAHVSGLGPVLAANIVEHRRRTVLSRTARASSRSSAWDPRLLSSARVSCALWAAGIRWTEAPSTRSATPWWGAWPRMQAAAWRICSRRKRTQGHRAWQVCGRRGGPSNPAGHHGGA
jgi:transcriptional accessory protein Tex/SPT6